MMRITIGEIVNELIEYSNSVDVSIHNGVAFLRARISTESSFTVFYLYVVQLEEHKYAMCDSRDDSNGERFFPTGGIVNPFVIEKDIIRDWFGISSGDDISYKYDTVVTDLNFTDFITHFHERLFYYEMIRFNPKDFNTKIAGMGFTSTRIRRTIEDEFKSKKCHLGTVKDLVDIVIRRKERFSLDGLRDREINAVKAKLRSIGISIHVDDDKCISSLKFDKKKGG